jgi:hypothetical protein
MNILKISLIAGFLGSSLFAQQVGVTSLPVVNYGVSDTFYNLSNRVMTTVQTGPYQATEMIQKHGPLIEREDSVTTGVATSNSPVPTTFVQSAVPRAQFAAVAGVNFEGPGTGYAGFSLTGAPPDTTLAVGPSHIIAWVNSQYAVFDKNGNLLLGGSGFANGNTLFTGTGNLCETTNRGDPILQYDRLADRWVLSQFAFAVSSSGSPMAPYMQCFAVSTTNNPLGSYYRYSVQFSSTAPEGFNDYAKLGVWPDGYYTSYNIFSGSPAGSSSGAKLCASDRVSMLAGTGATTVCSPTAIYGGGAAFLPGDLDGTTPPTTQAQGNIFMRQSTAPALRMIKFKPDYITPANTTMNDGFGGAPGTFVPIPLGATNRACNGSGGTCVAQPGTATTLDTLGDRLMYRLAYRNRGGVDSLMVTQSVDPDGAGTRSSALRWYEIRSPFAATPTLFQNSTFDPGAAGDRWMGSIAMDKLGNMALGYSVVNAGTGLRPSIGITGRLRTDLRNQMQAEQILLTGTGSQTTRSNGTALTRWGDYTTMQVDPANDCTFWYIGQYLSSDGVFNWRTRIASFKFNGCN